MKNVFSRAMAIVAVISFIVFSRYVDAATVNFAGYTMEANGSATETGGVLRLTPDSNGQRGSAFINSPFPFNADTSFSTFFRFRIYGTSGSSGADGLTFILQNDPAGMYALGNAGGGLGYMGVTNSLAVEFDTYENGPVSDPNDNHIGVNTNGSMASLVTYNNPPDLNSGNLLYAWIDYNGETDTLNVYIDTTNSKPNSPVISHVIDIYSLLGSQAYVGFSAATGGLHNIHDIEDWVFKLQYTLTVTKAGTGSGTVTSSPAGINCGNDCTELYDYNTVVTLTAAPDPGSTFTGWSGDCTDIGNKQAQVTMNAAKTCTATFMPKPTVTANALGNGTGSVSSNPAGISYNYPTGGASGSASFDYNSDVVLTATADPGSTVSWNGTCTAAGGTETGNGTTTATCTFNNLTEAKTATATFTLNQHTITASANPSAGGSVTCSPNPVNHGSTSTCTITTNAGYTLQNVEGTCGGTLNGNIYTTNPITADCTVVANFAPQGAVAVPTMTEWGMIVFIALAGLVSVYYLRRRSRA